MEYVSPSDAFSSSLEQSLLQRAAMQRQTQMDQLAIQREARQTRIDDEERQQAREALAEKRREFGEAQNDKQKAAFEKSLANMMPGDIPSPEMVEQSKKFGLGHLFPEAEPTPAPLPAKPTAMAAPMPQGLPTDGAAPQAIPALEAEPELPKPVMPPSGPRAVHFFGLPKQREQKDLDAKVSSIRDRLSNAAPGSPEERAAMLDYEMVTNKTIPAGFTRAASTDEPVARQNPRTGVVERLVDGVWKPVTGDVPKGTHFMTVPDHSASDAAGSARDAEALRKAYDGAVTEMNTRAKPIEGHIAAINDLGMVLNERTPQADALIAPMVLKATVSGTGTGFRMTQSEINQVIGARSKWDSLSVALNKWSADPSQALSISDEQRTELRQLAKAIRAKAQKLMDNIIKTRHELDDATDPKTIKQLRTRLQNDLSKGETDDAAADGAKPKLTVDEIKKKYGG